MVCSVPLYRHCWTYWLTGDVSVDVDCMYIGAVGDGVNAIAADVNEIVVAGVTALS